MPSSATRVKRVSVSAWGWHWAQRAIASSVNTASAGARKNSCRHTYRLQRVASSAPAAESGGDTFELCG